LCKFVCERERVREKVYVCEIENVCVCVCVCEIERDRERESYRDKVCVRERDLISFVYLSFFLLSV